MIIITFVLSKVYLSDKKLCGEKVYLSGKKVYLSGKKYT